ncbi:hypothetical protein [Streptomyces nanshensis]|uniref:Uncharacterized protein n=1 Tax=Streptomyces nanshensis TaxID=518642 RepID=A0A1E7L5Q1_9ACTN|nr:hypothetical protein [Streptomyces nanshensis]OEV11526.1 hypothetical protein AN218_12545 [Streptomyces nanshensis]
MAATFTPDEVTERFRRLPGRVTTKQIADATGRGVQAVQYWIDNLDVPEVVETQGRTNLRDRDAVLEWYLDQKMARHSKRGPQGATDVARALRPTRLRLSMSELADELGLANPRALYFKIKAADPQDPPPPEDANGRREWAAMRSWLLRREDPLPPRDPDGTRKVTAVRQWILANAFEETEAAQLEDEHGLTVRQRDALERARVALAAGAEVSLAWLAKKIGVKPAGVQDLFDATASPAPPQRMGPKALAETFDVPVDRLKGYIRRFTPETSQDPFPATDEEGRDVDEVHAWLTRFWSGKS